MERRKILGRATLVLAGAGLIAVALMFIGSLKPANVTKRERVLSVDLSQIARNTYGIFEWNDRPVVVFRTGKDSSEYLVKINKSTGGPFYTSSSMPEFFAYELLSTYRGCRLSDTKSSNYRLTVYEGWYDQCHMGVWDYSGRNIHGEYMTESFALPNLTPVTNFTKVNDSIIEFKP